MYRYLCLVTICGLVNAAPATAQESNRPFTPSGEIQIPSRVAIDRMLDSNTVPAPNKEFSSNDAKAIQEMDQQAKRIDLEVKKGICNGC